MSGAELRRIRWPSLDPCPGVGLLLCLVRFWVLKALAGALIAIQAVSCALESEDGYHVGPEDLEAPGIDVALAILV